MNNTPPPSNIAIAMNDTNLTDIYNSYKEKGVELLNNIKNDEAKHKYRVLLEFLKSKPNGTMDEYKSYYYSNFEKIVGGGKRKSSRKSHKKKTRRHRRKSVRRNRRH